MIRNGVIAFFIYSFFLSGISWWAGFNQGSPERGMEVETRRLELPPTEYSTPTTTPETRPCIKVGGQEICLPDGEQ